MEERVQGFVQDNQYLSALGGGQYLTIPSLISSKSN